MLVGLHKVIHGVGPEPSTMNAVARAALALCGAMGDV